MILLLLLIIGLAVVSNTSCCFDVYENILSKLKLNALFSDLEIIFMFSSSKNSTHWFLLMNVILNFFITLI